MSDFVFPSFHVLTFRERVRRCLTSDSDPARRDVPKKLILRSVALLKVLKVVIRLLKGRLKVLLKVLIRLLKACLKVLLKVLIRLLKARLKVLLKILIRLLKARM